MDTVTRVVTRVELVAEVCEPSPSVRKTTVLITLADRFKALVERFQLIVKRAFNDAFVYR